MKMKQVLSLTTVLAALIVSLPGNIAHSQPTNIPTSYNKLYEYALTQVKQIYGQVYAPSMPNNNRYFSVSYTNDDADPAKMAALVGQQHLPFTVDPADSIQNFISYQSQTPVANGYTVGYGLFYGSTNFHLLKAPNGKYVVPANAYNVPMDLGDWIPFSIPGIAQATIQTVDTNGNFTGYYDFASEGRIDTASGLLFLGEKFTSLRGDLYVDMTNGTRLVYGLGDGNQHKTVSASVAGITPTLKNIRSVPDNTTNITYQAGDQIVRAHFTSATTVSVSFPGGLSQYPVEVYVIDSTVLEDNPMSDGMSFNPMTTPITFVVTAGQTVLIRYEYPENPQPLNNYYGGGVGVKGG